MYIPPKFDEWTIGFFTPAFAGVSTQKY